VEEVWGGVREGGGLDGGCEVSEEDTGGRMRKKKERGGGVSVVGVKKPTREEEIL